MMKKPKNMTNDKGEKVMDGGLDGAGTVGLSGKE